MKGSWALALSLLALCVENALSFYLPGVAPMDFRKVGCMGGMVDWLRREGGFPQGQHSSSGEILAEKIFFLDLLVIRPAPIVLLTVSHYGYRPALTL